MNALLRRRAMMAAQKKPLLPPEYQQVEWIGSSGSAYLRLSFSVPTTVTHYRIKTAVRWHDVNTRQLHGANSGRYFGVISGYYQNSQAGTAHTDIRATADKWESIEWVKNDADVQLTVGSDTDIRTSRVSTSAEFALFKLGGESFYCICDLKGTIVEIGERNYYLIPCYRKADGVIGMYDTVSNTFFTNAGTGTFTKGADVN